MLREADYPMRLRTIAFFLVMASPLGCAEILGLDAYGSGGTGGGAGGTTTTTSDGGSGGTATTSSEGGGGSGGTGTTSSSEGGGTTTTSSSSSSTTTACAPGHTEACYDGPPETEGVGTCKAGSRTCDAGGLWGACEDAVLPQIEVCATTDVDENCDRIAACTGQLRWVRHFPAAANQAAHGVAVDPADDHVVVAGFTAGSVDFGGGPIGGAGGQDVFVVKLDPYGTHVWSRAFGDAGTQAALAVAIGPDGHVVLAGRFAGTIDFGDGPLTSADKEDLFVAALDAGGATLWSRSFGGLDTQEALAVAVDAAGDVYVTGSYMQSVTFGAFPLPPADGTDLFVARLDGATGEPVWAKAFGTTGSQIGRGLAFDKAGFLHVVADSSGKIKFDNTELTSAGANDVVVARIDPSNGAGLWSVQFGDATEQLASRVAAAGDAGVIVSASVRGTFSFGAFPTTGDTSMDVALFHLDAQGAVTWVKRAGAAASGQLAQGLAVDASGSVLAAGTFITSVDFSGGAGGQLTGGAQASRFFAKLDPAGGHTWSHGFENAQAASTVLAADTVGRVLFAGNFQNTVDFGSGPLATSGAGDLDVVIGQLAP